MPDLSDTRGGTPDNLGSPNRYSDALPGFHESAPSSSAETFSTHRRCFGTIVPTLRKIVRTNGVVVEFGFTDGRCGTAKQTARKSPALSASNKRRQTGIRAIVEMGATESEMDAVSAGDEGAISGNKRVKSLDETAKTISVLPVGTQPKGKKKGEEKVHQKGTLLEREMESGYAFFFVERSVNTHGNTGGFRLGTSRLVRQRPCF